MPIMQYYQAHTWSDKELITAKKMNDIENAIATINNNAIQKPSDVFTKGLKIGGDGSVNSNRETVLLTVYGNSDNARIEIISTDTSNWAGENRLFFRERATTGNGYESYYLPTIDAGLSSAKTYEILTTKKSGLITSPAKATVSTDTASYTTITQIQLTAGTYIITGLCSFASNSTGYRWMGLCSTANSDYNHLVGNGCAEWRGIPVPGAYTVSNVTAIVKPTSTTTYYLNAYQTSGGALSIVGNISAIQIL